MIIRKGKKSDIPQVWSIFQAVIKLADTYVFDPSTSRKDFEKHWFAEYLHTYVIEVNGTIEGSYILKENQIDLGSHIANGSYMVHPDAQGQGFGKAMGEHSIIEARKLGFRGLQFNMVITNNQPAVNLWKGLGFIIVGTIPEAFFYKKEQFVDAHIMFKKL